MFTLDSTGIKTDTLDEIISKLQARAKTITGRPDLDVSSATSGYGNVIALMAEQDYEFGIAVRDVFASTTANGATGQAATDLALVTGTIRPGDTFSTVVLKLNLAPGATIAKDSVFRVPGEEFTWFTQAEVTNGTIANADFSVAAIASAAGPVRANAGTITEAVSSLTGLNSVTNPLDAEVGRFAYTDAELSLLRLSELQASETNTLGSIDGSLRKVDGVLDVKVKEAPGTINAIIWDGTVPDADDDEIAQTIQDKKSGGIVATGSASGSAVDFYGTATTVAFDRAAAVPIYFKANILIDPTKFPVDGDAQVVAAILSYISKNNLRPLGQDVISQSWVQAAFSVAGVVDVPSIYVGTAPSPSSPANIAITDLQVATYDSSRGSVAHV